jgi:dihydrofolate reductase
MRKLAFGMNVSLDGYIAAPGNDLSWSVPSDELFQWWSDRVGATGLALYGRKLWEAMSSHWPTADQQPGATPAQIEYARRWRDMPKVVFSSATSTVDWNTRLFTGDAVTEITRLKAGDGGPMDIAGATLAAAAMRAGLIDEYALVTHPVLVGGGTPFFTALDNWVNLGLVETRTFPGGVVLTRYETGALVELPGQPPVLGARRICTASSRLPTPDVPAVPPSATHDCQPKSSTWAR